MGTSGSYGGAGNESPLIPGFLNDPAPAPASAPGPGAPRTRHSERAESTRCRAWADCATSAPARSAAGAAAASLYDATHQFHAFRAFWR
jgi:hypothetical protein